jgi:hypothetical protein
MPKIISIPTPCHEDWNAMTPEDRGRHCAQCCKTVVDFTEWQPQEILFYLQENAAKKVCGRFAADQLNEEIVTPEDFVIQLSRPMPFLRKAAAIFLFAFSAMMVSCTDRTVDKQAAIENNINMGAPENIQVGDTTIVTPPIQGKPALIKKPRKDSVKKCTAILKGDVAVLEPPQALTGMVAIEPPPVFQDSTKRTYKTGKIAFSDTAKIKSENSHKSAINK